MTQDAHNPPKTLYHGSIWQGRKILLPRVCESDSPAVVCASDIFQYALAHSFKIPRSRCLQMTITNKDSVVGIAVFAEMDRKNFDSQFEQGPIGSVYVIEGKSFKHFKGKEWRSERPIGVRGEMTIPCPKFLLEQGIQFYCVPDVKNFIKELNAAKDRRECLGKLKSENEQRGIGFIPLQDESRYPKIFPPPSSWFRPAMPGYPKVRIE